MDISYSTQCLCFIKRLHNNTRDKSKCNFIFLIYLMKWRQYKFLDPLLSYNGVSTLNLLTYNAFLLLSSHIWHSWGPLYNFSLALASLFWIISFPFLYVGWPPSIAETKGKLNLILTAEKIGNLLKSNNFDVEYLGL